MLCGLLSNAIIKRKGEVNEKDYGNPIPVQAGLRGR
jgi:hypothetical protein